jgi:hypothetical protein
MLWWRKRWKLWMMGLSPRIWFVLYIYVSVYGWGEDILEIFFFIYLFFHLIPAKYTCILLYEREQELEEDEAEELRVCGDVQRGM